MQASWEAQSADNERTLTGPAKHVKSSMQQNFGKFLMSQNNPNRLNISLSGVNVAIEAEELRTRLEIKLKQRLSMAQVMKRLVKNALLEETKSKS